MAVGTKKQWGRHTRWSGAGAADTALTISTDTGRPRRLLQVAINYSAAPTQAGATVTLNSGAGAAYDFVLNTGSANAQSTVYAPAQVILAADDTIDVLAPAGGGVITATIAIYTEDL